MTTCAVSCARFWTTSTATDAPCLPALVTHEPASAPTPAGQAPIRSSRTPTYDGHMPTTDAITAALASVEGSGDPPTHHRTGMVKSVSVDADGAATIEIFLTIAACPMRSTLTERVEQAALAVPG